MRTPAPTSTDTASGSRTPRASVRQIAWRVVLLVVVTLALGVAVGVVRGRWPAGRPAAPPAAAPTGQPPASPVSSEVRRDELAAAPMRSVPPEVARPHALSLEQAPILVIPAPTGADELGVRTGFPRTPEGALAQLAAIDQAVLGGASVPRAQAIITAWAIPGGPTAQSWSGVRGVAQLLSAAGLGPTGGGGVIVTFDPSQGQIKATDGDDWVIACVNGELVMDLARTARTAVSDCQRLAWVAGMWRIAAGAEPAPSPSVWPGTAEAIAAGWKDLHDAD